MSDRTVEIGIRTTADTTGARAAAAAVQGLGNAAATTANQSAGMARLAQQAGYQISDFAVQVQMGQSAFTAFSQQFPQLIAGIQQSGVELKGLGNGIMSMSVGLGTAIGVGSVAAGIAVQMLAAEYGKLEQAIKGAEGSINRLFQQQADLIEVQAKWNRMLADDFFARQIKAENALLESQLGSLSQRSRLLASRNRADEAIERADSGGVRTAANVEAGAARKIAEVDQSLQDQRDAWKQTREAAEEARLAALEMAEMYRAGKISEETLKAKESEAESLAKQTQSEAVKLDEMQRTAEDQKAVIYANAREEFGKLAESTNDEMTKQAQALQGQIAAMAPAAFSGASAGLEELNKILADGQVKGAQEIAMFKDALIRIGTSREGADKEVAKTVAKGTELTQTMIGLMNTLTARQESMEKTLQSLTARVR